MGKRKYVLTEPMRQTLECCRGWSAPYEVAERRRQGGQYILTNGAAAMLSKLLVLKLVERHGSSEHYRISLAGRSALRKVRILK